MRLTCSSAFTHLVFLGLTAATLASQGCSADDAHAPTATQLTHTIRESIAGGVNDTTDVNVVGIYNAQLGGLCTGSLIAPNLVLTAHHCVSKIVEPPGVPAGSVVCGQSSFAAPAPGTSLHVTTKASVTSPALEYVGQEIMVPDSGVDVCATDVALIILKQLVPDTVATPLEPRVDIPVVVGEPYKAVGYGGTNDKGAGAGTRRSRDGLSVKCAENCAAFIASKTDFIGETGVCEGDSGGPALDANGMVIGVTSRGLPGCVEPVYGNVSKWGDFIKAGGMHAADLGGYPVPAWVTGQSGTGGSGGSGGSGAGGEPSSMGGGSAAAGASSGGLPTGSTCTAGTMCASGTCIADQGKQYCTDVCTSDAQCVAPYYKCSVANGVCVSTTIGGGAGGSNTNGAPQASPASGSSGGCALSRKDPTKPVPWKLGVGVALAGLALRRRRRA